VAQHFQITPLRIHGYFWCFHILYNLLLFIINPTHPHGVSFMIQSAFMYLPYLYIHRLLTAWIIVCFTLTTMYLLFSDTEDDFFHRISLIYCFSEVIKTNLYTFKLFSYGPMLILLEHILLVTICLLDISHGLKWYIPLLLSILLPSYYQIELNRWGEKGYSQENILTWVFSHSNPIHLCIEDNTPTYRKIVMKSGDIYSLPADKAEIIVKQFKGVSFSEG